MKGASIETMQAVMRIVQIAAVGFKNDRNMDDMAQEIVPLLHAMCDRCKALRAEPTADYRECSGACPGTECTARGKGL